MCILPSTYPVRTVCTALVLPTYVRLDSRFYRSIVRLERPYSTFGNPTALFRPEGHRRLPRGQFVVVAGYIYLGVLRRRAFSPQSEGSDRYRYLATICPTQTTARSPPPRHSQRSRALRLSPRHRAFLRAVQALAASSDPLSAIQAHPVLASPFFDLLSSLCDQIATGQILTTGLRISDLASLTSDCAISPCYPFYP
ncbi:hypothetical protein VTN96DRAFT_4302 [Rasamsonia emersonii]